ncbi:hypothetical protein NQZ68_025440 [Dissostichus eleginoides]|nr:hypothetical protein NQZ68_025440 [Dissostichus eleginoides]
MMSAALHPDCNYSPTPAYKPGSLIQYSPVRRLNHQCDQLTCSSACLPRPATSLTCCAPPCSLAPLVQPALSAPPDPWVLTSAPVLGIFPGPGFLDSLIPCFSGLHLSCSVPCYSLTPQTLPVWK